MHRLISIHTVDAYAKCKHIWLSNGRPCLQVQTEHVYKCV